MVREGHADSTEFQLGIGPLLGLLAAPGACLCFLMLNNYSSLLNWFRGRLHEDLLITSAPDKYLFLSIAMGITGIVTALKWDRTLPDSQDYLNLAPLPLRPRDILLANATAIGIAVLVLALDVSGASVVLFPLFVTAAAPTASTGPIAFMAAHALCVILASLFAFCLVGFARIGAGLEGWILVQPVRFLPIPAAMSAAYFWNQARLRNRREAGELEEGLSFESGLSPAVQQLRLDGE